MKLRFNPAGRWMPWNNNEIDLETDGYGKGREVMVSMTPGSGPLEPWVPKMRGGPGPEGSI